MNEHIYDYFVVGSGLAGICFSETALQQNKTVFVFDNNVASSRVAAGVFNAVILKRFTLVSNAQDQIDLLVDFYSKIENKLGVKFLKKIPTYKKLSSIEEQNNFIVVSDRPLFQEFLSSKIIFKEYKSVASPFGFGEMKQTGYVDTSVLLDSYNDFLLESNSLSKEEFNYSELIISDDFVSYKGKRAKNIIFSEGFFLNNNPFFNDLPLDGTKGELLVIKSKGLNLDVILKAGLFVLPIGNDLYKVGATYNWEDKTNQPTENAKQELLTELKDIIDVDFEVVDHLAGVRPTVKDRNPLVGRHNQYDNLYVLNGLGTRGVMLAPYLSQKLFDFIESDVSLDTAVDIKRVYKKRNQ